MAQYTPLPQYADEDAKVPLVSPTEDPQDGVNESTECAQRRGCCARGGWLSRMRARCAARQLAKYGPPCENPGCQLKQKKRRRFRIVIFSLAALFILFHLFKAVYMVSTVHKHIECSPVTSTETTLDLRLARKLFVDYSLTTGTTTITHGDIPEDSVQVNVEFESIPSPLDSFYPADSFIDYDEEKEEGKLLLCTANYKHASGVGAYATKGLKLPNVVKTTIVLPEGADGPGIRFGGKRGCIGRMMGKLMEWKGIA